MAQSRGKQFLKKLFDNATRLLGLPTTPLQDARERWIKYHPENDDASEDTEWYAEYLPDPFVSQFYTDAFYQSMTDQSYYYVTKSRAGPRLQASNNLNAVGPRALLDQDAFKNAVERLTQRPLPNILACVTKKHLYWYHHFSIMALINMLLPMLRELQQKSPIQMDVLFVWGLSWNDDSFDSDIPEYKAKISSHIKSILDSVQLRPDCTTYRLVMPCSLNAGGTRTCGHWALVVFDFAADAIRTYQREHTPFTFTHVFCAPEWGEADYWRALVDYLQGLVSPTLWKAQELSPDNYTILVEMANQDNLLVDSDIFRRSMDETYEEFGDAGDLNCGYSMIRNLFPLSVFTTQELRNNSVEKEIGFYDLHLSVPIVSMFARLWNDLEQQYEKLHQEQDVSEDDDDDDVVRDMSVNLLMISGALQSPCLRFSGSDQNFVQFDVVSMKLRTTERGNTQDCLILDLQTKPLYYVDFQWKDTYTKPIICVISRPWRFHDCIQLSRPATTVVCGCESCGVLSTPPSRSF